jgi:hypothetical protein
MQFKIIWHDADDDRSGKPFTVEANSLTDAYFIADDKLKNEIKRYISTDIECIVDSEGQYHNPDHFLEKHSEGTGFKEAST